MSFDNLNIGKKVDNFETSETFDAYGRVDVTMGEDDEGNVITVSYPDLDDDEVSGRILTVDMPMCTDSTLALTAATRIYTSLNSKDPTAFQYVPHQTSGALADPSIEFGDSVDINGVHSGFHTRSVSFGRLMKHDIASPSDEELDHEYPYQDSQQRQITRSRMEYKARLTVTEEAIESEVSRATATEETLTSKVAQNASSITAEVSRATTAEATKLNHTRTNTSFGWKLTSDGFYLNASGNKNVFTCTSDGITIQGNATVTGKIQATSGYFGSNASNGFTIGSKAIYNPTTKSSYSSDSVNGVYIGTDGIALGKGTFKVSSSGAVTATNLKITGGSISLGTAGSTSYARFTVNSSGQLTIRDDNGNATFSVSSTGKITGKDMTLSGTLTVGGEPITAANLYTGAYQASQKYSGWDGTKSTVDDGYEGWDSAYTSACTSGGYCYGGVSDWNTAQTESSGVYYFRAAHIWASSSLVYAGTYALSATSTLYRGYTVTTDTGTYTCTPNYDTAVTVATAKYA